MNSEQGFREASLNQLKAVAYLLDHRELSRSDLESIDRWIEGMATFNPKYIIGWMKDRPVKNVRQGKLPLNGIYISFYGKWGG